MVDHSFPLVAEPAAATGGTYSNARTRGDFTTEYVRYAERDESVTSAISAASSAVHSKMETLGDVNETTFGTSFSAATIAAGSHGSAPQARASTNGTSQRGVRRDKRRSAVTLDTHVDAEARADCSGSGINRPVPFLRRATDRPSRVAGGIASLPVEAASGEVAILFVRGA